MEATVSLSLSLVILEVTSDIPLLYHTGFLRHESLRPVFKGRGLHNRVNMGGGIYWELFYRCPLYN